MRVISFLLLVLLVLPSVVAQEVIITLKPIKPIIYVNEVAEYAVSITSLNKSVNLVVESPTGFWDVSTKDVLNVGPEGLDTILYLKPVNTKTGEQVVPVEFKEKNKPFKITKEVVVEIIPDVKVEEHPGITGMITKQGELYKAVIRNEKDLVLDDVNLRLVFKNGLSNTKLRLEELEKKILLLNVSEKDILAKALVIINFNDKLYKFTLPIDASVNEDIPVIITPYIEKNKLTKEDFSKIKSWSIFLLTWLFKILLVILIVFILVLLLYWLFSIFSRIKFRKKTFSLNIFKKLTYGFKMLIVGILGLLIFILNTSAKLKPSFYKPVFKIFKSKKVKLEKKIRIGSLNGKKVVKVFLTFKNRSDKLIPSVRIVDFVPKNYKVINASGVQQEIGENLKLTWNIDKPIYPKQELKLDYIISLEKDKKILGIKNKKKLNLPKAKILTNKGNFYSKNINIDL